MSLFSAWLSDFDCLDIVYWNTGGYAQPIPIYYPSERIRANASCIGFFDLLMAIGTLLYHIHLRTVNVLVIQHETVMRLDPVIVMFHLCIALSVWVHSCVIGKLAQSLDTMMWKQFRSACVLSCTLITLYDPSFSSHQLSWGIFFDTAGFECLQSWWLAHERNVFRPEYRGSSAVLF